MLRLSVRQVLLALFTAVPAVAMDGFSTQVEGLRWQNEQAVYDIPGSRSTYRLGPNERLLLGEQARRFLELTQGSGDWRNTVALVKITAGPAEGSLIDIQYHELGYLEAGGWAEISPDVLVHDYAQGVWKTNVIREINGSPTLEVLGWVQEPEYDQANHCFYWAVRLHYSDDRMSIKAFALKLGRHGSAILSWMGDPQQFRDARSVFGSALSRYSFREGARYTDIAAGDVAATISLRAVFLGELSQSWDTGAMLAARVLFFLRKFQYIPQDYWFILLLSCLAVVGLSRRS